MSLVMNNHFNRFRSHSFEQNLPIKRSLEDEIVTSNKRPKTAPPSPPSNVHSKPVIETTIARPKLPPSSLRSKSLSPNKQQFVNLLSPSNSPSSSPLRSPENLKLPGIRALSQNNDTPCSTVSSEFFDTCSDKSWRSELLDKIMKESKTYHLTKYNYLNSNCKPNFTSKLSSKISLQTNIPTSDKKINFPFESNYTYLDGAFMTDVKNFPHYLKLAHETKSLNSPPTETPRTLQTSVFSQPKTPTPQVNKLPSFYTLPSVGPSLTSHTTLIHPSSSLDHLHAPESSSSAQTPSSNIPSNIATGQGSFNPLADLTGARYAGYTQLPSASMFGPDGGMNSNLPDPEQLTSMMSNPMFQEQLNAMLSNPQMLDFMIQQNPQLRAMGPQVREMMQSPMFRQMMTNPEMLRSMMQMQQAGGANPFGGLGGGAAASNASSFPAPGANPTAEGPASGDNNAGTNQSSGNTTSQGNTPSQANPFASLFPNGIPPIDPAALFGSANPFGQANAPADNRPPEERYESQLRQLNDMGFYEFERNVEALRRTGGSVQGAIEYLLNN
ncbi:unnamed protein product [Candida parapsilosis]